MVRIRRFGIIRTANMVAALYAFIALIFFGFIAVFALLGFAIGAGNNTSPASTFGTGIVGILLFGLVVIAFYAIIGWIFTAIACAIYNLIAGWVGGVEIQLESPPGGGYPGYGYPAAYGAPGGYPAPGAYPNPGTYPAPGPAPVGGGNLPPPAPGR